MKSSTKLPESHLKVKRKNIVSLAQALDGALCKYFNQSDEGPSFVRPPIQFKIYSFEINLLSEFLEVLKEIESDPYYSIILGHLNPKFQNKQIPRRKEYFLSEFRSNSLFLDFDRTDSQKAIASCEALKDCSYILQKTSSYGWRGKKSTRAIFHLDKSIGFPDMKRIASHLGADDKIYQSGRLLFTCSPFGRYVPQVKKRFSLIKGDDEHVNTVLLLKTGREETQNRFEESANKFCEELRSIPLGDRNNFLNKGIYTLMGIASADKIDEKTIKRWQQKTFKIARAIGLSGSEIESTWKSAFEKGFEKPLEEKPQLTDLGNSKILCGLISDKALFCHQKRKWLIYSGIKWVEDSKCLIYESAKKISREILKVAANIKDDDMRKKAVSWAISSESRQKIDAAIQLARSDPKITISSEDFDTDPYLVGCPNGTLDLREGKFRECDPKDFISKNIGCKYDSEAESPLWLRCLEDWTGENEELIQYLQRVAGYSLFGEWREKHFFFIYGPKDSGKSLFIKILATVLGDYAKAVDFSSWLVHTHVGGNRGDLVDLMGARLAYSIEVDGNVKFNSPLIKRVVGGDKLKFAKKYEDEIEFAPNFTLILAANDCPIIRDVDEGMWARLQRIPFPRSIPKREQDKKLFEKLSKPGGLSGILNWVLEGFVMWENKGIGTCNAVEKSGEEYRSEMDRCQKFFDDHCQFGSQYREKTQKLREIYQRWTNANGIYPVTARDFNQRLRNLGCKEGRSKKSRYWKGIKLNEDINSFSFLS